MSYSLCRPVLDNKFYHWINVFNSNDYFSVAHNVIKFCIDYLRKGAPFPQSGYDELDPTLIPPRQDHYRITPSPGGPIDRYGKCIFFIWIKYCCHLVFVVLWQVYYKISNQLGLSCIQYLILLHLLLISVFQGGKYYFVCIFHKRLWITYKSAVLAKIRYCNVLEMPPTFI